MKNQDSVIVSTFTKSVGATVGFLYGFRSITILSVYAAIASFAYATAYLLRFEFNVPAEAASLFITTLPALLAIRIICDYGLKLSHRRLRFAGSQDALLLALANAVGSLILYFLSSTTQIIPLIPRSVIIIEWTLTTYLTASLWIVYRRLLHSVQLLNTQRADTKRMLIVGAGEAGNLLAREMLRFPATYRPVGFLDDDPTKWRTILHGLTVFGPTSQIARWAKETNADEVAIAAPSASPADLRAIVERCEAADLQFKVLPGIREVLAGQVNLQQLRPLRIEDLLGREPVDLELPDLLEDLEGETVLITGAAGSIGSELARQISLHSPARLVLLDQAETPLFFLERELRDRFCDLSIVAVVADITDPVAVESVFRENLPSRVFHAAAYKHVPMMQRNLREALRNNTLGTWYVADAAGRYGSAKFVLVSTDKAVRPTTVMGATKRLAEMVVLEIQQHYRETAYVAVRFGNVLGSAGSVVEVFQRQIQNGDPLTVTHAGVTRYFMTIPEAVQLILKASLLPEARGQILMLEMGDPILILDLAKNLLRLSGAQLSRYPVVFTGLRDGEKLHEELVAPGEQTQPTRSEKVRVVAPSDILPLNVCSCLQRWETDFRDGNERAVFAALTSMFPDLVNVAARAPVPEPMAITG